MLEGNGELHRKIETSKLVCGVEDDLGARSDNHNYGRKEVKIH